MENISLDTRMKRARAGLCSSPEYILPGLKGFAELPVNAVMVNVFPDLQARFGNCMSTMYRKPSSAITYGDLAVIITDDYLRNGVRRSRLTDSLILFYFTCLEADSIIWEKYKDRISRNRFLDMTGLAGLRDITDLTVGEYLDAVLKMPMDEATARKLYAFRLEKAGVMNMTVSAVYTSLTEYAKDRDRHHEDPIAAGFQAHSLKIREHMVELFAAPVAYAAAESRESTY